jgi:hypothetical protein
MIHSTILNDSSTPLTVRVYKLYSGNVAEKCLLYVYPLRLELYQCYIDSEMAKSSSDYTSTCKVAKEHSKDTSSHVNEPENMKSIKFHHLTTYTFSSSVQIVEIVDFAPFSFSKTLNNKNITGSNRNHEENVDILKCDQFERCHCQSNTWVFNPLIVCVCCDGEVR